MASAPPDDAGNPGILFLVSTPIGNLGDMTYRAVETLRACDLILAEDTRHSGRLLSHYKIETPTKPYHDHNKERVTAGIVEDLLAGRHFALITDAGTPGISDPGFYLIRATVAAGVGVTAIPGASAVLTALVVSGFPTDAFAFEGFFPRKRNDIARRAETLRTEPRTSIFFVPPHQLVKVLEVLADVLPDRQLALARELTKLHEEVVRGTAPEILASYDKGRVRGEMVLVVRGIGHRRRA